MVCLQAALAAIAISGLGQPVLLDFYADWCAPCRAMNPTVEALIAAGYPVQRVNLDQNRALAAKYGVRSIPCFVMVADGQVVDRVVGGTTYSRLERMCKAGSSSLPPPAPAAPPDMAPPPMSPLDSRCGFCRSWRCRAGGLRRGLAGGQRADSGGRPRRAFLWFGHNYRRPQRRGPGADLRPHLSRLAGQGTNQRRPVRLRHDGASRRPAGVLRSHPRRGAGGDPPAAARWPRRGWRRPATGLRPAWLWRASVATTASRRPCVVVA